MINKQTRKQTKHGTQVYRSPESNFHYILVLFLFFLKKEREKERTNQLVKCIFCLVPHIKQNKQINENMFLVNFFKKIFF